MQTALAILFYALAVNLYGTASAIACLVLAWGYTFLGIIMPPSEIRKVFQPEKRRKMWQMQCLLAENLTDHLFTEMPEEYFAPPEKIQNQNDAALMINRSAWLVMQNRYEEALDILTMLAQEHREQTKRLWWQLIPLGVLRELALDKPGYFLKEYDTLYVQKDLRKRKKQPLVWRTAYAVHLLRDGDEQKAEQCRKQFLRRIRHTTTPRCYQWTIERMAQEKAIYESRKAKEAQE